MVRLNSSIIVVKVRPIRDWRVIGSYQYHVQNGRVAEGRGHWGQWLRRYVRTASTVVTSHSKSSLGSAVCKAILAKGIKVTSVR